MALILTLVVDGGATLDSISTIEEINCGLLKLLPHGANKPRPRVRLVVAVCVFALEDLMDFSIER